MDSLYQLISQICDALISDDVKFVYAEYPHVPIKQHADDFYVTVGVKEFSASAPQWSASSKIYPAQVVVSVNILCPPNMHYSDIYRLYDEVIIRKLLTLYYSEKIITKPLEFNKELKKLQLYSEFTLDTILIPED